MKTRDKYKRFIPNEVDGFMGTMDYKCSACNIVVLPQERERHFNNCLISQMRESLAVKNRK